jgi:pyridoxine kinase
MARILAISSQVARGTVGLSIIGPALQALGHDLIGLPTVVLSNHPGHAHAGGMRIDPPVLAKMLDALDANGWLADVDAVLTGYLPSVEHVAFATAAVQRVAERRGRGRIVYLCDPVLGDDPKGLYIDRSAAEAIRDILLPSADIATPNRFELSFLTGAEVSAATDVVASRLACQALFATSIPSNRPGEVVNVAHVVPSLIGGGLDGLARVPLRQQAPHGTGDLYSALILAAWLDGRGPAGALSFATAGVDFALEGNVEVDMISISALPLAATPLDWPLERLLRRSDGSPAPTATGPR